MKNKNEQGFSLIELLLVVVILGIVTAMGVPAYQKANKAAENRTIFGTLRTMSTSQVSFFSQNGRFARLPELSQISANGLGTLDGNKLVKGAYTFELSPGSPSDDDLKKEYTITATRTTVHHGDIIYVFEVSETGKIKQIFPIQVED